MIGIIDYGVSNLQSVANALEKLGIDFVISSDPMMLKNTSGLILPGVGAAGTGMNNLKRLGLDNFIGSEVTRGKLILGICLGMQLFFDTSEEGNTSCLGLISGVVKKYSDRVKVPQIGWNRVEEVVIARNKVTKQSQRSPRSEELAMTVSKLFNKIPNNSYFYFVNSYYCIPTNDKIVIGESMYGEKFASIIAKENILGVQFHPEKSGAAGFQLLKNFCELKGEKYAN